MVLNSHTTKGIQYAALSLAAIFVLYFGRLLFIPLFYGLFIAIVLYPMCKKLERKGWPKSLAIALGLTIVVVLFVALLFILVLEVDAFLVDAPLLLAKLKPLLLRGQQWIAGHFHITVAAQIRWLEINTRQAGSNITGFFHSTVTSIFTLLLAPVFAALFLYNRKQFVEVVSKLAGNRDNVQVSLILNETIHTYYHFVKGMIMVYIIVGILNSMGLLALGIKHALLFGFLTAIMTIIPYIGIFISALLPISVAWVTKDSVWYPVGVIAVFTFVQYLEANIIFPKVVASQLKVSTWVTLVAIIAGNIIWGVAGMILFIPFMGILKIITDHVPALLPLNILLSDSTMSKERKATDKTVMPIKKEALLRSEGQ